VDITEWLDRLVIIKLRYFTFSKAKEMHRQKDGIVQKNSLNASHKAIDEQIFVAYIAFQLPFWYIKIQSTCNRATFMNAVWVSLLISLLYGPFVKIPESSNFAHLSLQSLSLNTGAA
jgi:hypothetical protein